MSKKILDNIKRIKFLMEDKDYLEIDDIELDGEEVNEEIELDEEDVVRHKLVKQIIRAYDKDLVREEAYQEEKKKEKEAQRETKKVDINS